ncbi:MAG: hypothetical protein QM715_09705 [Nibricoccus sp.]
MSPPPLSFPLPPFGAVDEGLDRILFFDRGAQEVVWTYPLKDKCRSLQWLPSGVLLAVCETGVLEIDVRTGQLQNELRVANAGVISAERLSNGRTFVGGLGLTESNTIEFLEVDSHCALFRSVRFPGDYVRRASSTWEDTILFTRDTFVAEADWLGRMVMKFSIPGFRHAWKALRHDDGTTYISAGYGAFVVQCDRDGRELRRWLCIGDQEEIRPFFFGDFILLPHGGMLVCNWLGHGVNLGATGYSLLEFSAKGALVGTWRDDQRTSSLQTFVFPP